MSEDFEGEFPGTSWILYGSPTWDDESYRPYQGFWNGWCAGSNRTPPGPYAPNMSAHMIYGPFSLSDASDALVTFYRWNESEENYDWLVWWVSIDGSNWYGWETSGNYPSWTFTTFDLTNVPTLGNICGCPEVWLAFSFYSDETNQYEGAYLDNIVLKKYVGPRISGRPRIIARDIQPASGQIIMPEKVEILQKTKYPEIKKNSELAPK